MQLSNELWYNVFYFFNQQSQSKFSSLWNLHNLSTEEIKLIYRSYDLWFDTARKGHTKLMKLLIKTGGTDINIQDNCGCTALHLASIYGCKEYVELLIKAGANVNIKNNYVKTALHSASIHGRKEIVEFLIKTGGVDVNIQDNDGKTALHYANLYDYKDIVTLLEKND